MCKCPPCALNCIMMKATRYRTAVLLQNITFLRSNKIFFCMTIFQKFSKCNIGQNLIYTDRTGRVKLLMCTEKIKGVPQWKFIDGKETKFSMIQTVLCLAANPTAVRAPNSHNRFNLFCFPVSKNLCHFKTTLWLFMCICCNIYLCEF